MVNFFKAIWQAWQSGQIISNPSVWKSGGELATAVTAFVAAVFTVLLFLFPNMKDYLTTEMATLIGSLMITVIGIVQIVIGRITTNKKVGPGVLIDAAKGDK